LTTGKPRSVRVAVIDLAKKTDEHLLQETDFIVPVDGSIKFQTECFNTLNDSFKNK